MISELKHTFLYYVAPWSNAQRIRFTVLIFVCILLGWYVLIQRPLARKLSVLVQNSESCVQVDSDTGPSVDTYKRQLFEIEVIKDQVPAHGTLDALSLLLLYARESGMQFEVLSSDVELKKEWCTKVPVRIVSCAPYRVVLSFLAKVCEQKQLFAIKQCSLESVPDKKGYVACSCLITTYFF